MHLLKMNRFFFLALLLLGFSITARDLNPPSVSSSSFRSSGAEKFPPSLALDGKLESSWVEGSSGDGIGESLTVRYASEINFQTVAIYNGFGDVKKWANNNRIKKLKLTTDLGYEESFLLQDVLSAQRLNLKSSENAKSITLTILEVYKGKTAINTSIAELKFLHEKAGSILSPPKNTWALGKWKTETSIAKISLKSDGTCEMGYEKAKMLCTWTEKGNRVLVQLEATLPLTNTDKLELRLNQKGKEPMIEINGKFIFKRNNEEV